jgi:hypothetical protein
MRRNKDRMEEKGRKILGEEKGKWGKRRLSRLIFGYRGRRRSVTMDCSTKRDKMKKNKDKKIIV